jgi:hypothetical protein
MQTNTPVSFDELLAGLEWASAAGSFENEAYVNRISGKVFCSSSSADVEEDLPEDIEDNKVYLALPSKGDLGLGRELALRFVEAHLPESYELTYGYFQSRGAYQRFKALLDRKDRLEDWYAFEQTAVEEALRRWSAENDLQLKS